MLFIYVRYILNPDALIQFVLTFLYFRFLLQNRSFQTYTILVMNQVILAHGYCIRCVTCTPNFGPIFRTILTCPFVIKCLEEIKLAQNEEYTVSVRNHLIPQQWFSWKASLPNNLICPNATRYGYTHGTRITG